MDKLIVKANEFYTNKQWTEALNIYSLIIEEYEVNVPVEIYARLSIVQRFLKDYISSKKTILLGLKKFPNHINLLIEYASLENAQLNWAEGIKLWKIVKQKSKTFSKLNYKRYSKAYLLFYEKNILENTFFVDEFLDDTLFKEALFLNIRERITSIRNNLNNKKLALKYIRNLNTFFPHELMLMLELAISYMHVHQWDEAIEIFEEILFDLRIELDVNNYNRLAKCYEMTNQLEKYENLLIASLKKYSMDENLKYRYIYMTFLKDYNAKKFQQGLEKLNVLLGMGKPNFWHLDNKRLLEYRNECIRYNDIMSINQRYIGNSIIANRADGLGERLNAMLTAIVLAKTLGYKFGYIWKSQMHATELQKEAENNKNLVGHAVVDENDFFDQSFIDTYAFKKNNLNRFKIINDKDITYKSLLESESDYKLDGWISPRLDLKEHLEDNLLVKQIFSYKDAFQFIKFNKNISKSIDLAKKVMQKNKYIALHLRSGDVFYGEYRKFVHYTYKGIVLPLAKKIIEKHLNEGIQVIVFGQDIEVLKYLKNTYKILTVDNFEEYKVFNETEKAMFEIVLMSEAESIIAGSSGFAKLASWIGDKSLMLPSDYFSAENQTKIIKNDLKDNENLYPALQTSFAYWYAYFYGRQYKKIEESKYLLERAYKFDENNELYPIILSSLYYKDNLNKEAENILEKLFFLDDDYIDIDKHKTSKIVLAKTMGKLNILEFIVYFADASKKDLPFASVIMYILTKEQEEKKKYLSIIKKHIEKNKWLKEFYEKQIKGLK